MRTGGGRLIAGLVLVAALCWVSTPALAIHSEDLGCNVCHVPHMAVKPDSSKYGVPLWSPSAPTGTLSDSFTVYTSPTFDALGTGITHPDGPSKLCLGCHDGTYTAVTAAHTFGDGKAMTLTESHPISFVYDTALSNSNKLLHPGELRDPATALSGVSTSGTIAADLLDKNGKLQCTSCHDVHVTGKEAYQLRWNYTVDKGLKMCTTCHNK